MIHKVCSRIECKNEFDSKDNRKIYCSRSCAAIVNNSYFPKRKAKEKKIIKPMIDRWLDGEWNGTVRHGLSTIIRNYLLEVAEYKCQDGRSGCNGWSGINPKSGKTCLTVDHIDGNAMNNNIENLRVMCPNCHAMTPTYGGLNKGNGNRPHRYSKSDVA